MKIVLTNGFEYSVTNIRYSALKKSMSTNDDLILKKILITWSDSRHS